MRRACDATCDKMSMREGVAVVYWQRVNMKCGDLGHQTYKTYRNHGRTSPFYYPALKRNPLPCRLSTKPKSKIRSATCKTKDN